MGLLCSLGSGYVSGDVQIRIEMVTSMIRASRKIAFGLSLLLPAAIGPGCGMLALAQTPAPAASPAAGPKLGTVKAVAGNVITLVTDAPASQTVTITVPDGAKVQQLAVGSTDLKTATASQMSDVA